MEGRTTRSGYLSSTIEGSHLSQGEPGQWAETAIVLSVSYCSGRVAVPRLQHNGSPLKDRIVKSPNTSSVG